MQFDAFKSVYIDCIFLEQRLDHADSLRLIFYYQAFVRHLTLKQQKIKNLNQF